MRSVRRWPLGESARRAAVAGALSPRLTRPACSACPVGLPRKTWPLSLALSALLSGAPRPPGGPGQAKTSVGATCRLGTSRCVRPICPRLLCTVATGDMIVGLFVASRRVGRSRTCKACYMRCSDLPNNPNPHVSGLIWNGTGQVPVGLSARPAKPRSSASQAEWWHRDTHARLDPSLAPPSPARRKSGHLSLRMPAGIRSFAEIAAKSRSRSPPPS